MQKINQSSKYSKEFQKFFLLEFTRELILNSDVNLFRLKNMVEDEEQELPSKVKEVLKEREEKIEENKDPFKDPFADFEAKLGLETPLPPSKLRIPSPSQPNIPSPPRNSIRNKIRRRILRIPEPRLPLRLQYLKPTPTNVQIDLGKLDALIRDPLVREIECNGPDETVFVKGTMGRKSTSIMLTRQEIDWVLGQFSQEAKIPIQEGTVKIVVGSLVLSAITSEFEAPKFVIKKMILPRVVRGRF